MSAFAWELIAGMLYVPLRDAVTPMPFPKRRRNALHPFAGQEMPPRARLDDRWRARVWRSFGVGMTIEDYNAANAKIWSGCEAALQHASPDYVALLLVQAAETLATPRPGRPIASGGFNPSELDRILCAIWFNEDGTPAGRTRAVAAEVSKVPLHKRRALRVWLNRHLPPVHEHKTSNRLWVPTTSQMCG